MIPRFYYNSDPFIIIAQVPEAPGTVNVPEQPEFEVPQNYSVDEAIAFGGKNNQLIRISYVKTYGPEEGVDKDYTLEPYSYRVRGGKLFLFAFDVHTDSIKAFRADSIKHVQVLPDKFNPKWIVEL